MGSNEEEEKDMFARRWNQGSAIPPAEATSLVSEWVAMRRRDCGKNRAGSPKIIWNAAIHCAKSNLSALWTEAGEKNTLNIQSYETKTLIIGSK